ncbi:MAG: Killer protein [Candidatus Marinimicrobia bacterium]|nr:Killer protein [Candidatus Neomarinimicrobiota bacterium]MBT3635008.1 Killer protein [Candidatus Neomarinimicrobiota bacterium]MBT3683839.1 Killer protein [Candidatus Neomarinimicrobiota bacterium]MBT3760660.1 Killer protein [Candidatus Neomarinimicrobiota bacterium]MBT3896849.1 Killer protein [Candidatus Neomarinimicrobiota bacterium]
MIVSFKHKGLRQFYESGSIAGIQTKHSNRLRLMFAALDTALHNSDMNIPGFRPHQLKGSRDETWAISVSGNWRLTFNFMDGNVHILNYEDYH